MYPQIDIKGLYSLLAIVRLWTREVHWIGAYRNRVTLIGQMYPGDWATVNILIDGTRARVYLGAVQENEQDNPPIWDGWIGDLPDLDEDLIFDAPNE